LDSFRCEPVGVARTVTLSEVVALELAQVIAELIEAVVSLGEMEAGENGVVNLLCRPAAEVTAAMQEDLEEADGTGVRRWSSGKST